MSRKPHAVREHRDAGRLALVAGTAAMIFAAAAATSGATITPTPDRGPEEVRAATRLARAIADDPKVVRRAVFSALPPRGNPAAVSSTPLAGFPISGKTYGILSSGNALFADGKNDEPDKGAANLGPLIRGARDVTILRVYLRVPKGANCLAVRFRFLSEEFPEFVKDEFNDAFIAELDKSTWQASGAADPRIVAPDNFAVDGKGNPIRVNAVGPASVAKSRAKGTTYDAATRRLRASTRIKPGRHSLYLSIFDQGDRDYDSAVFLDRLTLKKSGSCASGVVIDD